MIPFDMGLERNDSFEDPDTAESTGSTTVTPSPRKASAGGGSSARSGEAARKRVRLFYSFCLWKVLLILLIVGEGITPLLKPIFRSVSLTYSRSYY